MPFHFSDMPVAEPLLVPVGRYFACPLASASEVTGTFTDKVTGKLKTYLSFPLELTNEDGETWQFNWNFGPHSQMYIKWMTIMGGEVDPKTFKVTQPPEGSQITFQIQIGQKQNKDGTKLINEVLDVYTDNRKARLAKELEHKKADEEIDGSIPF